MASPDDAWAARHRAHVRALLQDARVDEAWQVARAGRERAAAATARVRYEVVMAEGDVALARPDLPAARRLRLEAHRIALAEGDEELRVDSRVQWAQILVHAGDLEAATDELRRAAPFAARHLAWHRTWGRVCLRTGDLDAAEAAQERLRELGDATTARLAEIGLAHVDLLRGRAGPAAERLEGLLARARDEPGGDDVVIYATVLLGDARRALGRIDDAAAAYDEVRRRATERRPAQVPNALLNVALVRLLARRFDDARALLADPALAGEVTLVTRTGLELVRACLAAADGDGPAFDRAAPWLARGAVPIVEPDHAVLAALAAAEAERRPEAAWSIRAVRARRAALRTYAHLRRPEESRRQEQALRRLADRGAPAPLGPFLLRRRLGRGAFGEVWAADHDSGFPAAVKVLRAARPEAAEMLRNELRTVAALDHPAIVRVLDHGVVDDAAARMADGLERGTPWIAMERADGGTLEPALGRLPWDRVRAVLLGVLDGLAHAHARGVLHLDLKPANVLLAGHGVRLADFGLASARLDERRASGTPQYMAPEQVAGDVEAGGPWTDLYALGCLAVALVAGRPPFSGATVALVLEGHAAGEPEIRPVIRVPAGFDGWARRLLAKDPRDRFRCAADAAAGLLRLGDADTDGSGVPAPFEDAPTVVLPVRELARPARRRSGDAVRAEVPVSWERASVAPHGLEASLGLFGLRPPPFVGRRRERTVLWEALRAVAAEGRARRVAIEAPSGLGATALVEWLCERAQEVGAAVVADDPAEPRDRPVIAVGEAEVPADRPVLVVTRGPSPLALGPLADDDQRALVSGLLPLEDGLLEQVVAHTAGHPLFAVQLLTHWVRRGALAPSGGRFGLRSELHGLPPTLDALLDDRVDAFHAECALDERRALAAAATTRDVRRADHPGAAAVLGRAAEARLAARRPWGWRLVAERVRAGFADGGG